MSSIFHSFPPPVGPGNVTVGEQNGELTHVKSGQAIAKVRMGHSDLASFES